ncbi:MAG TPA: transcription antitermination factor NusB [Candidatus Nanopelagicaceae bacterium]|nr:transcription antitermination factor NusB [Candidatus Nanopelagicaceae bacterium]
MAKRVRPDPARLVAFEMMRAVWGSGAYANLVMPSLIEKHDLNPRDAGFAIELGYGTLRMQGQYDAILSTLVNRPLAKIDPPLLDVLRLGSHQLLHMRVPDHAALNSTVDLAHFCVGSASSTLVNAVLRKVAQKSEAEWVEELAPLSSTPLIDRLSVEFSHPTWIISAYRERISNEIELRKLLAANNTPAAVTLVARPGRCTVAGLLAQGAEPGRYSPFAATWTGDPGLLPEVRSGQAGVQDEGSQLVALALTRFGDNAAGQRWLDLCAGPGGKAALLGAIARESGAQLVANEISEHRAKLVQNTVDDQVEVVVGDGLHPSWPAESFDRVLADVPCTGLGALRRRPEARWRKSPSDIASLRPLQLGLFESAYESLRPGGVLAYVTCSPHLAETEMLVDEGLERTGGQLLDARELFVGVPELGRGPTVQLWPHIHQTDAMFFALIQRPLH